MFLNPNAPLYIQSVSDPRGSYRPLSPISPADSRSYSGNYLPPISLADSRSYGPGSVPFYPTPEPYGPPIPPVSVPAYRGPGPLPVYTQELEPEHPLYGLGRRPESYPQPEARPAPPPKYNDSGLNAYERQTLRMWGHDIQDDGKNDGSVLLKSLLNPKGSDNEAFVRTPEAQAVTWDHLRRDLFDDGQINGSSIRQDFAQIYQKVTGHDISGALNRAPYQSANLSLNEIFRQQPDMRTADGLKQVSQNTGLSVNEFLNTALWGHDAFDRRGPGGRNIDGSVLGPSLYNPRSIDYGFVNSSPGTKAYTQGLIDRDIQRSGQVTGQALNQDFVQILNKIYGTRIQ
jgi:hypothetical protein